MGETPVSKGKPRSERICLRRGEAEASNKGRDEVVVIQISAPGRLHIRYGPFEGTYRVVAQSIVGTLDEDDRVCSGLEPMWMDRMRRRRRAQQGALSGRPGRPVD